MSWRIDIVWDFISPAARAASGMIRLKKFPQGTATTKPEKVYEWRVTVKDNSYEWKGETPDLIEPVKDAINNLVRGYFDGMVLKKCSIEWILFTDDIIERGDEWTIDYMI
jgi:hypothetical protein